MPVHCVTHIGESRGILTRDLALVSRFVEQRQHVVDVAGDEDVAVTALEGGGVEHRHAMCIQA